MELKTKVRVSCRRTLLVHSIFVNYSSGCPLKFCVDGNRPCDHASVWSDIPFDSRTLSCNPNISSRVPEALNDKKRIPAQPEKGSLIDGLQAERMDSCLVGAGVLENWRCLLVGIAVLFAWFLETKDGKANAHSKDLRCKRKGERQE